LTRAGLETEEELGKDLRGASAPVGILDDPSFLLLARPGCTHSVPVGLARLLCFGSVLAIDENNKKSRYDGKTEQMNQQSHVTWDQ
jgi:hypothetical protein